MSTTAGWWSPRVLLILGGLLSASCTPSSDGGPDASIIHIPGESGSDMAPKASWASDSIDLGILAAGEVALARYTMTNTGRSPLYISQIVPSCGCTVAREDHSAPLSPGEQRVITLEFNAGDRIGEVTESATVVTNAIPSSSILTFSARILGPGSDITP